MNLTEVRWGKVIVASIAGTILVFAITTLYAKWQWSQGSCVRYFPDGSEKLFFGKDCGF